MIWNTKTLSEALGITIPFPIEGEILQFNSNDVKKGDIFIALKSNGNGHDYAVHALAQGASAVIISRKIDNIPADKTIIVDDSFKALEKMANYKRRKSKAVFIAITGSVGKTSTKEALHTILSAIEDKLFASRGNFNNHLGMLLNLASMPNDTRFAIFEVGMNHSGELKQLSKILKPHIAMITNVSEAHLEFFDSVTDIVDAKCEIFEGLEKEGIAIVNTDSNYDRMLSYLKKLDINNIYGFGNAVNTTARLVSYDNSDTQTHLKYEINKQIIDTIIPFIPKHFAENYAAMLLVISLLNKDINTAAKHLADIKLTKGRGEIINIQIGGNNCRIICDYYNSSPKSMKAALEYLKQLPNSNKTAIIGEMLELGVEADRLHQELVPYIVDSGCSKVFLIGAHTKCIYNLLPTKITKKYFNNVDELIINLKNLLENNELILIKGSNGVNLKKIIDYYQDITNI